ncbi:MAG: hypothetical protein KDB79_12830 [Acidobacteria bacterium]|nr:hypothetical protein [Acidobacteriota bacterium]
MKEIDKKHIPPAIKQGWSLKKIVEQAAGEESDEIVKKVLRGDADRKKAEQGKDSIKPAKKSPKTTSKGVSDIKTGSKRNNK